MTVHERIDWWRLIGKSTVFLALTFVVWLAGKIVDTVVPEPWVHWFYREFFWFCMTGAIVWLLFVGKKPCLR